MTQLCLPSDPCEELNCGGPGYECQIHGPSGTAFCAPVCGPGSCPLGQQCSISPALSCTQEPCPGTLNCQSSKCGAQSVPVAAAEGEGQPHPHPNNFDGGAMPLQQCAHTCMHTHHQYSTAARPQRHTLRRH